MLFRPQLLLLFACSKLAAQSPEEPRFTCYTRVDGLSNNSVNGIVQDSIGYIWVATNHGLNRFDGRFFKCYYSGSNDIPLPADRITQIKLCDRKIIGSTNSGTFAYDPISHQYKALTIPCDSTISYWENSVWDATMNKWGDYILSSKTGLYAFDTSGRIIHRYDYYHTQDVGRLELWFGGRLYPLSNGIILQKTEPWFCAYDPRTGRIDTLYGFHHPAFNKAVTDQYGNYRPCYSGGNDEVFIFNASKNTLESFDFTRDISYSMPLPFDGLSNLDGQDNRLFFLGDSLLGMTSKIGGFFLLRYDKARHVLTSFGPKYFEGKQCSCLFRDKNDRLWVGTIDGLYKQNISNPFFQVDDLAEQDTTMKNFPIRCIYGNREHLFLGLRNRGGVLVLDKATKRIERRLLLGNSDFENNISLFFPYCRDTLWVGTQAGLFWLELHHYRSGRIRFPPDLEWTRQYNCLYAMEDSRHLIWVSFDRLNSLICYNRATRSFTGIELKDNPLLRITYCFSMAEDLQGNLWFAGDGICRWNRIKERVDTLIPIPTGVRYFKNYLNILDRDDRGNLWLYSIENGILQFNCTDSRMYVRRNDDAYSDRVISPIIRGHIWMSTFNGIASFDIRDYSSRTFTYAEGLPTVSITTLRSGAWYDTSGDRFYFGSQDKLVSLLPDLSRSGRQAPDLLIDQVSTSKGTSVDETERIVLPYAGNYAQLSFNAVNFQNPEDNQFSYRVLPSADSFFHPLTWQRSVNFNSLSPGKYRLQVKLSSADNRWPDQVKEVQLLILPPFWESWWFILLCGGVAAACVAIIYSARVHSIREKLSLDKKVAEYEMKALHAQMNPHFIFNALNSIREMILQDDNQNASRYLTRFARLIRLTLEHSKQTFITLHQHIEYLESYLEMELLRFADFTYHIEISPGIERNDIRIAPMLIQPLVENAIWHGLRPKQGEKHLDIRFYSSCDQLVCEIEDNGIGILQSRKAKEKAPTTYPSTGIANIRQRLAVLNEKYKIKCTLTIQDKGDNPLQGGTLVILIVPAPQETTPMYEHD